MNNTKRIILLGAILLWTPYTAFAGSESDGKINWSTYANAKQQNKENRKYFIYFRIDQCSACKLMDEKTFKDKAVIDYINKNFTPIKVNGDKETKLASSFGIWAYPHLRFLTPEGESIAGWPGYIESGRLLTLLEYFHTDSYKSTSYKDFVNQQKGK